MPHHRARPTISCNTRHGTRDTFWGQHATAPRPHAPRPSALFPPGVDPAQSSASSYCWHEAYSAASSSSSSGHSGALRRNSGMRCSRCSAAGAYATTRSLASAFCPVRLCVSARVCMHVRTYTHTHTHTHTPSLSRMQGTPHRHTEICRSHGDTRKKNRETDGKGAATHTHTHSSIYIHI